MKYRVCKMADGNGDEWYQVQSSRYGLFWKWDCSWPWVSMDSFDLRLSPKHKYQSPRRFDTIEDARHHIGELRNESLAKEVRLVDVISDAPQRVVEDVLVDMASQPTLAYATPDLVPPADPVVTETKPTKKKAPRRGRKKTS